VWEKEFAENFFTPAHDADFHRIGYGPWMLKFCVSVSWRTLKVNAEQLLGDSPQFTKRVTDALQCWSDFLLNKSGNITPYEQHVFVLGFPERMEGKFPDGFLYYLLRSIDATPAFSRTKLSIYSKVLRIMILAPLSPLHPSGLRNTRVFAGGGAMISPQQLGGEFGTFLLARAKEVLQISSPSEAQRRKIQDEMLRNPERVLKSESFQVKAAEHELIET